MKQTCRCVWGFLTIGIITLIISTIGCTPAQITGSAAGITYIAGRAPSQEIKQIYYLGVLDPLEQVPPTVYRVTIWGQASFTSNMKFGSGWIPAQLIDSLNTHIEMDEKGLPTITSGAKDELAMLKPDRRFIEFGPEGFREVPDDYRLVIVMGADPSAFFEAIDKTLGSLSDIEREKADSEVSRQLLAKLLQLQTNVTELKELQCAVKTNMQVSN